MNVNREMELCSRWHVVHHPIATEHNIVYLSINVEFPYYFYYLVLTGYWMKPRYVCLTVYTCY